MSINCIRALIEKANRVCPDNRAIVDGQTRLSYAEVFKKVNQIARYFTELNLPSGSRIGIYSHKSSEQIIAILAMLSTEYIFVPISRLLKPEQVDEHPRLARLHFFLNIPAHLVAGSLALLKMRHQPS